MSGYLGDNSFTTSILVAGPKSLWHLDGHHSLITWGFVIHGVTDGFSLLVTFLYCLTNNRSGTVADLLLNATQEYGWHQGCEPITEERTRKFGNEWRIEEDPTGEAS